MKGDFQKIVIQFPKMLTELINAPTLSRSQFSTVPNKGIYLFSDQENRPLYIGRTDRMRSRLLEHSRQSSGHTSATFAFLLVKEIWDKSHPTETRTRSELEVNDEFKKIYDVKKNEVALMNVRVIEIPDATTQALFEIFASLELDTPYNIWKNH